MIALTLKTTKKRLIILALLIVAAIVSSVTLLSRMNDARPTVAEKAGQSIPKQLLTARSNQDRIKFIAHFGWEVQEEPCEIMEVLIPQKFDEVYEQYNEMQKQQGFNLEKQRGKRAKRYSYIILNYPDYADEVRINILISGTKVVGGDVCSTRLDGFMHGFYKE